MNDEEIYVCVGICQADPDSGYCMGCGRPPLESPGIVAVREEIRPAAEPPASTDDPDTPA